MPILHNVSLPIAQHSPRQQLIRALLAYGAITLVATVCFRLTFLSDYFNALVAALFLYVPASMLWREGHELEEYGLTARPLRLNLAVLAIAVVVVFPLFGLGFVLWQKFACGQMALRALAPGPCMPSLALPHFVLRAPAHVWQLAAAEFLVVALPEEFFFRGFLQGRLAEIWPAHHRFLGAPVGLALLVAAALFAVAHLIVQGNPATLMVFFPALLFGWMRSLTGSIAAGTIFHALCNLYMATLHRGFFG